MAKLEDERKLTNLIKVSAWIFLMGFLFASGVARGVYSSQGIEPSGPYDLLERAGVLTFLWYWLRAQCRPYRAAFPLDLGLFIAAAWIVVFPYYLWRYERGRGLLKLAAIVAGFVTANLLRLGVQYALALARG